MTEGNSDEFVNPRIIDFTLSRWVKADHVVYIAKCNGVFYGCAISNNEITPEDIAKEIFDIDITPEVLNSRLSKFRRVLHDSEVDFFVSVVRTEVSYGISP